MNKGSAGANVNAFVVLLIVLQFTLTLARSSLMADTSKVVCILFGLVLGEGLEDVK